MGSIIVVVRLSEVTDSAYATPLTYRLQVADVDEPPYVQTIWYLVSISVNVAVVLATTWLAPLTLTNNIVIVLLELKRKP